MASEEIAARLLELGIELPPPPTPKGAYVPVVIQGRIAWVSGMLPLVEGELRYKGKVDTEVNLRTAEHSARTAALNALAALQAALGSLDRIDRIIRVGVFVASVPEFTAQPTVANAASEVLLAIFGERGKHARAAVGTTSLPLDAPVEVEMVVALRSEPSAEAMQE